MKVIDTHSDPKRMRHEAWLVDIYARYCKKEGLPHYSCDELLHEDITDMQRTWLTRFYLIWTALEDE